MRCGRNSESSPPFWRPGPTITLARELEVISRILDGHPGIADAAWQDLTAGKRNDTAAEGMKAASDVGAAVLQRLGGHFYESMVFHLVDSSSYRCFTKLGLGDPAPNTSTFQANTKKLSAKTWEAINRVLFGWAEANGIEKGRKVSEMVRNP